MKHVSRFAFVAALAASCAPLGGGCGSSSDAPPADASSTATGASGPPAICKVPAAPSGTWYKDITAKVLPQGGDPDAAPTAGSVRAGDFQPGLRWVRVGVVTRLEVARATCL